MSRTSRKRTGRFALKHSLAVGTAAFLGTLLVMAVLIPNLTSYVPEDEGDVGSRAWRTGVMIALVAAAAVAIVGYVLASSVGSRVTDLALAVAKIGRRGADVRVRLSGNDEITALGRAVQYLASDMQALLGDRGDEGGAPVTMDPQVRELRDRTVPQGLEGIDGYELDGALEGGSRGGLDYFDGVVGEDGSAVAFLVGGEGQGPLSVVAARMARDELLRALKAGATPRKALAHTNRVLHKNLPRGACAMASLLQLQGDEAKLYQAGARSPLLICSAGEVQELSAEGLALGLDEGPVFDKALRPEKLAMGAGTRLVLANEGALRQERFLELVQEHAPKHTAPFMNMVLGNLAADAGEGGLREDAVLITAKRSS